MRAVEVLRVQQPDLSGGLQEQRREWVFVRNVGDVEWSVRTVKGVIVTSVVLGTKEVRQDIAVRPASVAELSPMVVVTPVASHVQQEVQAGRTTQDPSARAKNTPSVEVFLRNSAVGPV